MFSLATALQIYGIVIAVSMSVTVFKWLVVLTSRVKPVAKVAATLLKNTESVTAGITAEVVEATSAAVSIVTGQHHILRIAESKYSWASEGRAAQHYSHQPRH